MLDSKKSENEEKKFYRICSRGMIINYYTVCAKYFDSVSWLQDPSLGLRHFVILIWFDSFIVASC